jgi:hypothetical protein
MYGPVWMRRITVGTSSSKLTECSRPNRMAEPLPCPCCTIRIWSTFTKTSFAGGPGRFNAIKTAISPPDTHVLAVLVSGQQRSSALERRQSLFNNRELLIGFSTRLTVSSNW